MGAGSSAGNTLGGNSGITGLKNQAQVANDPYLAKALQAYSKGGMSLNDAIHGVNNADTSDLDAQIANLRAQQAAYNASHGRRGGGGTGQNGNGSIAGAAAGALGGGGIGGAIGAGIGSLFGGKGGDDEEYNRGIDQQNGMFQAAIDEIMARKKQATDPALSRMRTNALFSDPLTGSLAATDQVRSNPLLSGMFGEGGQQQRWGAEEQELASRGWSLKPEDHEAYGMASDNVARLSGQQESGLANALAARGLSAGASGAAGAGFSGLAGNKFEQLAGAQRKIADDRMKMNNERLNAVRGQLMQTNQLANTAIGDQYGRNQQGIQTYNNQLKDAAHAGQMEQNQANVAFEQNQATQGPGIGDYLGMAAGAGLGAATGGLGTSLGAGLGQKLGGAVIPKKTT